MLNRTLTRVVDEPVNEFGIIPAIIAAGAAVTPAVMASRQAGKDAKAQKRAVLAQQVVLKKQQERDKKVLYWSIGGAGVLIAIGTIIYFATRRKK